MPPSPDQRPRRTTVSPQQPPAPQNRRISALLHRRQQPASSGSLRSRDRGWSRARANPIPRLGTASPFSASTSACAACGTSISQRALPVSRREQRISFRSPGAGRREQPRAERGSQRSWKPSGYTSVKGAVRVYRIELATHVLEANASLLASLRPLTNALSRSGGSLQASVMAVLAVDAGSSARPSKPATLSGSPMARVYPVVPIVGKKHIG